MTTVTLHLMTQRGQPMGSRRTGKMCQRLLNTLGDFALHWERNHESAATAGPMHMGQDRANT